MSMDPFRCQRAIQTAHVTSDAVIQKTAAILIPRKSTVRRIPRYQRLTQPLLAEKQLKANRKRAGLSKPSRSYRQLVAIEAASLYLTAFDARETAERMGLPIPTVYSDPG